MNKNSISMIREIRDDRQTQGQLFIFDEFANLVFQCFTLELPWRDNQRRISCIPEGRYKVAKRYSKKYKWHLHILDVPGRDWILIHPANYVSQLLGCIAVGRDRLDINGDGLDDVTSSVLTMKKIMDLMPDQTEIVISDPVSSSPIPSVSPSLSQ